MNITNEKAFEEAIEHSLIERGDYVKGDPGNFDRVMAIDPSVLFQFIQDTQKDEWNRISAIHGTEVKKKFLYRLNQELDTRGMLDCLRNGITDYGRKFKLAYFKPVSSLNPETQMLYAKNILTVTRQVHFSDRDERSVDLLLSVNGLPVATLEIKNPFTGQDVEDAKRQYKYDRNEEDLLFQFKKRALVHFAVDTDEVYMTTRLQGSKTRYLPFNKGYNKGAGNYQTFFNLSKRIEDDPDVNKKKAAIAIARFVTLHPYNLAQKTEVIIEHFRQITMKKIGGKAKAMVVTASREQVVRYKHEFDRYLNEKNYHDVRALVAFSGTVLLDGIPHAYTEAGVNGFGEKQLPDKFASSQYQILLVAEKYQTGFDQPFLHTMYVDKRLDGVKAVQTLSRLNRTCPGKEDTFVLDFVNKREDILAAFQPYYEQTKLEANTDPNKLYDLRNKLDSFQIIYPSDLDAFCHIFFKSRDLHTKYEHAQLNALVDAAVERLKRIEKEEHREDFDNTLGVFVRLFLAQIIPFQDPDLEKYYAYCRFLLKKLPRVGREERFNLGDEVALEYYRLQKMTEGSIELQRDSDSTIKPITEAGTKKDKEEFARLSEIMIYNILDFNRSIYAYR